MSSNQSPLGERFFLSADVVRLAGVSPRQLQWWDERKLVIPRIQDRHRAYTAGQLLEILTVAALRRKGLSLQKVRKILRQLRRELERNGGPVWSGSNLYLLTDGTSMTLEVQPEIVLARLVQANKPTYVVSLSDQMNRVTSTNAPHRYRALQIELFEDPAERNRARVARRRRRSD